ncbi:MAG TPA: histidine phosphatase family protein [Desulfobacteraceae bacterium]|nr:histidine phosphatase family protein [Desulfobacteraceae bacterium]
MEATRLKNRYYVLRHGQSEANIRHLVVSAPENGVDGYGLTKTGEEQVKASVTGFSGLGPDTLIYSSDFKRARETAQIAAGILGVSAQITHTPMLRERFFGEFELGPDTCYPGVWEKDAKKTAPENRVEPVEEVLKRTLTCIGEIESAHRDRDILLVAHGDTLQILLTWFNGMPACRHRDVPHLDTAELRQA